MVTCKIDQEVSPKKLSETTRTDRENLKGGHLLSKYSAMWFLIKLASFGEFPRLFTKCWLVGLCAKAWTLQGESLPKQVTAKFGVLRKGSFWSKVLNPELSVLLFEKWKFTWSLELWSCRGRVLTGKASDGEPGADCHGAPSTWSATIIDDLSKMIARDYVKNFWYS